MRNHACRAVALPSTVPSWGANASAFRQKMPTRVSHDCYDRWQKAHLDV